MKFKNLEPDGNEKAELEPARYFNLAIDEMSDIILWLKETNEPEQAFLLHMDIFIYLSKKYPDMARRRKRKINIEECRAIFYEWFSRVNSKIPSKFRDGIKESADKLFVEFEAI